MPTSSIAVPYKIYPNWDFWFENIPPGNPDAATAGDSATVIVSRETF
jgi:hypothetical protein